MYSIRKLQFIIQRVSYSVMILRVLVILLITSYLGINIFFTVANVGVPRFLLVENYVWALTYSLVLIFSFLYRRASLIALGMLSLVNAGRVSETIVPSVNVQGLFGHVALFILLVIIGLLSMLRITDRSSW